MSKGRTPSHTIPYKDLDIVFVTNYYDVPLSGTCIHDGKLCEFECSSEHDDPLMYAIYRLSFLQKIKAKFTQWKFEQCVGYHWSYHSGKKTTYFYIRKPKWLYTMLYKWFYRKNRKKRKASS